MASIHRRPLSPYFFARYRNEHGKWVEKTTKKTDRAGAMKVAMAWSGAAEKARRGELTRTVALQVLADMVESTTGERLNDPSVREHFTDWLAQYTHPGTIGRYKPVVTRFLKSMGDRAGRTIRGVITLDVTNYIEGERQMGLSESSCALAVKILKGGFRSAMKRGLITFDPAGDVKPREGAEGEGRTPFKAEQIRKLLAAADDEWRGMILLGATAGLRINDAASLTWESVDLVNKVLTFTPQKTRRSRKVLAIALHLDLLRYLEERASDDNPRAPLFPSLHGKKTGSAGGLSNAFGRLMMKAKVAAPKGLEKKGRGRQLALLSFHSLRHAFVSALADAEISSDVRKAIAGHSSDQAHAVYTHLDIETQRRALSRLPRL